jgi:AGZA family xanthine/uracil permease-like MFS transporter
VGLRGDLRDYQQAAKGAIAAAVGALLALFGVIHSPAVGFAPPGSLMFVTAYLMMGGMFVVKHVLDRREAADEVVAPV